MLGFFKSVIERQEDRERELIADIKARYGINDLSRESQSRLRLIAAKGPSQVKYFNKSVDLLQGANILGNFEQRSEQEKTAYGSNLRWLIKVSKRNEPKTVWHVLNELKQHNLLEQQSVDKLKKRQDEEEFLPAWHDAVKSVNKEYETSSRLRSIVQELLSSDEECLLSVSHFGTLKKDVKKSGYFLKKCFQTEIDSLTMIASGISLKVVNDPSVRNIVASSNLQDIITSLLKRSGVVLKREFSLRGYIQQCAKLDSLKSELASITQQIQEITRAETPSVLDTSSELSMTPS